MKVNPHAILRYKQRTGSTKGDIAIQNKILLMFERAHEVQLKPQYRVMALCSHKFVEARYFRLSDWILVVRENEIITIHEGTAERWED